MNSDNALKKQNYIGNRPIEPEQDYSLWERLYGRVLTDEEQLEIKLNLTSFFEVLIDEHKKQSKN